MPITVKRKEREPVERMLRTFNRSVQISGILKIARKKMERQKEDSKKVKRQSAIRKRKNREIKIKELIS